MRSTPAVRLVESKPATEWLMGRPVQKVSPRYSHAAIQTALSAALKPWAAGRGRAGTEWRFWIAPPGEASRYLVPDVAYLSYERMPNDARAEAEEPAIAPDVAFEIRSPSDRDELLEHKIDVYVRGGAALVVIADPAARTLRAIAADHERMFAAGDTFEHPALPGLRIELTSLFAVLDE